jgi:hypothetical protein
MTTTLGVLLLIAVGVIGVAIEDHKQKVARIAELEARLTPWNKGKSGYKQPRKAKGAVVVDGVYHSGSTRVL